MSKKLVVILLSLVCYSAIASPIVYWGSDGGIDLTAGDVFFKDSGGLVQENSDWLVQLINVDTQDVLFELNSGGFLDGPGLFYADAVDADGWNGFTVKSVIYDAKTVAGAGFFAEFTKQYTFSWTGEIPPVELGDYSAGVVTSVMGNQPGQWQAIPEPAVASFIAIFGVGIIFTKRIFSKA